jgi:hypothetical protein
MVKKTKKLENWFFYVVFDYFKVIWAPPNGPKKELEGLQVERKYVSMSKHKNKPLTKSSGPFF